MLHLVRDKSPYTVIILLIFTLIAKLQALTHPIMPPMREGHEFYNAIVSIMSSLLGGSAFAFTLLGVIMLFIQAIYLNAIVAKYKLYPKVSYIPTFLYILLSSLHPSLSYFSLALLINWCLIASIDVMLSFYHTQQPRKQVFNAGFILCIAALLHFPAVLYIITLFAAMLLLRSFNPSEWVVAIMGYITPVYFFAGMLFLFDKLKTFPLWSRFAIYFPDKFILPVYTITLLAGAGTLLILGLVALQGYIARLSVFNRRNWVLMFILLIISFVVSSTTDEVIKNIWLIAIPAAALIISHALYLEKSKWFSNFAFYFSLLILIVCQWAL